MSYPENVGIKAMEIYFPSQVRTIGIFRYRNTQNPN